MSRERRFLCSRLTIALATAGALGCGKGWGGRCAADDECMFSRDEWTLVQSLANVAQDPPPVDDSNGLFTQLFNQADGGIDPSAIWEGVRSTTDPAALPAIVRLGWRLYHDPRLSGDGHLLNDASGDGRIAKDNVGRAVPPPRTSGQLLISCADCHDPARFGGDFTSLPPNVSNGAGYYDVNAQQTLNVARFFPVFYWNGRADSLWSQAAQVMESAVSMNGRREKTLSLVTQCYLGDPDFREALARDTDVNVSDIQMAAPFVVWPPATARTVEFKDAFARAVTAHPEIPEMKYLAERVHRKVAQAIAAYEWFLSSDDSLFDQFVNDRAGPASTALNPSQKRGLKLFIGHAGCVNCHNTRLFSDRRFHNIGVGQSGNHVPTEAVCTKGKDCDCSPTGTTAGDGGAMPVGGGLEVGGKCSPAGAYAGMQKLHAPAPAAGADHADTAATTLFRRCWDDPNQPYGCVGSEKEPNYYPDPGQKHPNGRWLAAWRTPSLRDVAMTPPYMHDGSLASLADVIWHYDQAATGEGLGKMWTAASSELAPLNLTEQDRADLVAFLGTLTGQAKPQLLVAPRDPESSCTPADSVGAGTDASVAPDASPDAGADGS